MRKDVVGYEGKYVIEGTKIISLNYNHTNKEKELKPQLDKHGYLLVPL